MGEEQAPSGPRHVSVLADAAVAWLVRRRDGRYVDATLGDGGHAERICRALEPGGMLLGIDRDPAAHEVARKRLRPWGDRLIQRQAAFGRLGELLDGIGWQEVSGVLFDLGVSSSQLDVPERGFSYRFSAPLDMRMGPDATFSARDVVNDWPEEDLVRVLREYGEEPAARAIARDICRARAAGAIERTDELARIIGRRGRGRPEKTLARVYQAIRIVVNREFEELEGGLAGALAHLEPGGRIVVIAYHSLEDRIVKRWMQEEARGCICPPDFPICRCGHHPRLRLLTKHVITPGPEEVAANPRARSARMRVAERLSEPLGPEVAGPAGDPA